MAASARYGIPYVFTVHNRLSPCPGIKGLLFRLYNLAIEERIWQNAAQVIAVGGAHLRDTASHLVRRYSFTVVPNGVDVELFHPMDKIAGRLARDLPLDVPVVLFVGALDDAHRFKNLEVLIQAFATLPRDYWLVVAGGGNRLSYFRQRALQLGVSNRVRFLGTLVPEDLPEVYSSANVTVLPSSTESFGMVLLESMACGTPVVASNLPGVREVVVDNEDGILVEPGDVAALARAIRHACDPGENRRLGARGRARAQLQYDWKVIGDQLEEWYEQIVTGSCSKAQLSY